VKDVSLRLHDESEKALAELKKQGIDLPDKPEIRIPSIPEDITDLSDNELMDLFTEMTAWSDFIAAQVACASIDERAAARTLEYAEATAMLTTVTGKTSDRVAFAKAARMADPDVRELTEDLDAKHAYRKLVEVLAGNLDRDVNLVSRELTRRTSDYKNARRSRFGT
jgi:hypothetical protein